MRDTQQQEIARLRAALRRSPTDQIGILEATELPYATPYHKEGLAEDYELIRIPAHEATEDAYTRVPHKRPKAPMNRQPYMPDLQARPRLRHSSGATSTYPTFPKAAKLEQPGWCTPPGGMPANHCRKHNTASLRPAMAHKDAVTTTNAMGKELAQQLLEMMNMDARTETAILPRAVLLCAAGYLTRDQTLIDKGIALATAVEAAVEGVAPSENRYHSTTPAAEDLSVYCATNQATQPTRDHNQRAPATASAAPHPVPMLAFDVIHINEPACSAANSEDHGYAGSHQEDIAALMPSLPPDESSALHTQEAAHHVSSQKATASHDKTSRAQPDHHPTGDSNRAISSPNNPLETATRPPTAQNDQLETATGPSAAQNSPLETATRPPTAPEYQLETATGPSAAQNSPLETATAPPAAQKSYWEPATASHTAQAYHPETSRKRPNNPPLFTVISERQQAANRHVTHLPAGGAH